MTKKKGPNHELEQRSRGRFQSLFADWVVNPLVNEDYAFDFEVRPTGEFINKGEVLPNPFYVQLKATTRHEDDAWWDFDVEFLTDDCLQSSIPVALVLYEQSTEALHWRVAQSYCWDHLDEEQVGWRDQETVRIGFDREPLTESFDKHALKTAISRARDRINNRETVASAQRASFVRSPGVDLATSEEVAEYEARMVEEAKVLLDADETKIALEKLMKVYQTPEDTEATLDAVRSLLEKRETDDPAIALTKLRFSRDGFAVAEIFDRDELKNVFEDEFGRVVAYLEEVFVGATYLPPNMGVPQTVLDIDDYGIPDGGANILALTQSPGSLEYESAQGIAETQEMVESGESWDPREDACAERSHEFRREELLEFRGSTECADCGLYRDVVEQWLGHDVPEPCDECGSITYDWEYYDRELRCPECR